MPDIQMCSGEGCVLAKTCYRHLADPSEYRQAYYPDPPFNSVDETCRAYVPARITKSSGPARLILLKS